LLSILVTVVVVIVMPTVGMIAVVITMVFAIPVAFMHLPALLVVVVVGVAPVGAGVRWSLPDAGDPDVAVATLPPIAVDPGVALSWHGWPYLISHRWGGAEIDLDLTECRGC
jgi:hypothetical protein